MVKKLTAIFLVFCLTVSCILPQVSAEKETASTANTYAAAPIMQEVYEAEDAGLSKATTAATLDDFSAGGYIDRVEIGGAVTFTVTVPKAGNYGVRLRYTNGSGTAKQISCLVGETKIGNVTLSPTINWNTWDVQLTNMSLTAGVNTITFKNVSAAAFDAKLDKISLSFIYEAENAERVGNMGNNNDHVGYSGTGFASGFQNEGQGVSFDVNVAKGGEYSLVLRYAAGQEDSNAKSVSVYVNGSKTKQLLNSLRNWDIWGDSVLTINLNEGDNKIIVKKDSGDDGQINLDYITVKEVVWEYTGAVKSVTGSGSGELTFTCDNAVVKIYSVGENAVKVWADPEGKFSRKYESFTVINDAINPQKLNLSDKGDYYSFSAGDMDVRVYKNPFKLVYLDKQGNVILENGQDSMGWTSDGELVVNNKLQGDEQFWGLGEKLTPFNRRGQELAMWSHDAYGAEPDASVPTWENGRWYMSNPYFTSSKGYSIFFDNASRTVFDLGKTSSDRYSFGSLNPNPGGDLVYYFIYGPDQKQLVKTYTDMSGKSFFAPDWAYGNIQCHYGYTQKDIERVAKTYREKKIPLDVMMADIEWYEYLCSPTTWSSSNFPNPEGMLELLDSLNLKMGLINDPNITNRDNNADFVAGNTNGYFVKNQTGKTKLVNWPWGGPSGLADFFNPDASKWWGTLMNKTLDQGVACFWLDMNEPAKYNADWLFYNKDGKAYGSLSEVKNAYAIKHQEAVYDKVTENGQRTLLLTRSGFTGTQRYASPWTGDIQGSWQSMHEQINMGTSLSLTGYNYWGFDIGGFFSAVSDDQYKRWVELATFTPIHRFHYANGVEEKEPWTHNSEEVSKKYINLRYTIQPYLYSYTADNIIGIGIEDEYGDGGTGIPLVRPMLMEFPKDTATYNLDTQYMCGESFLVAPVVESGTKKQVYLPKGNWYDYDDGYTVYSGEKEITYDAPIDLLPVFVKEGSIIPMQSERQYMNDPNADPDVTLDVYPTVSNGTFDFVLYEDDGQTEDYKDGEYATTKYDCSVERGNKTDKITLNIGKRTGSFTDISSRDYILKLHGAAYEGLSVQLGGKSLSAVASLEALDAAASGYYSEKATGICYVKVPDTANAAVVTLTGNAGSNNGMVFEAETGTLTGCTAKTATIDGKQATVVTGFSNGSSIDFSGIAPVSEGDYSVEIQYASGAKGKTITLSSGDESYILKTESENAASAVGVLHLEKDANTIKISANDPTLAIDKIIISQKPTNIGTINQYDLSAKNSTLLGGAVQNGDAVTLNSPGNGVSWDLANVCSGTYSVKVKYKSNAVGTVTVSSGNTVKSLSLPAAKNDSLLNEAVINLPLSDGINTVSVVKTDGGVITVVGLESSLTPYTTGENIPNKITNPGFETGDASGWTVTDLAGKTGGYGIDGYDSYSGERKFYFFNGDQAIEKTISQTVTGLTDGYYIVRAKTKLSNATANLCQMILSSGDIDSKTTIDQAGIWETTSNVPVLVKGGTLKIQFYIKAPATSSLQIDDVELYKADIQSAQVSVKYLESLITASESYSVQTYDKDLWIKHMTGIALARKLITSEEVSIEQVAGYAAYLTETQKQMLDSEKSLLGDLDLDGSVNVSDVVKLRSLIMKGSWSANELYAGDLDKDSKLTVTDVVALRSLIMKG